MKYYLHTYTDFRDGETVYLVYTDNGPVFTCVTTLALDRFMEGKTLCTG